MKILGVVQWTTRDKGGNPIAGVRPLFEIQKAEWRPIESGDEFPTNGQVFWPNAQQASEGMLVTFRAEPNVGQKDEFRVVEPKLAHEVIDLRSYGSAEEVRAALTSGLAIPAHIGSGRIFVWCTPDVLIGPIDLHYIAAGKWKLHTANLHHLPTFTGAIVKSILVDRHERLLRVDDSAPSGYVDWDEDAIVLRRAIEAAVRIAKQAGHDSGQTKRQIDEAARSLVAKGLGSDSTLDLYRLQRALALLDGSDLVSTRAGEIAELLREHPDIKAALEDLSKTVREDAQQMARVDLEKKLAKEHAALKATIEKHAAVEAKLQAQELEVAAAEKRLLALDGEYSRTASEAEAAIDARLLTAINRPIDLLAEVSVLRPLLGHVVSGVGDARKEVVPGRPWARSRGVVIEDRASLRRILTSAARARGVDPSQMLQVHAAIAAGLVPITIGASALSALVAYTHGACGDRVLILHVSPGVIEPRDLEEALGGGLVAVAEEARDVDGISLVVLEGVNRSPLEAALVPLLQKVDLGLSTIASARGFRIASTLVTGATTVPVTPQVWHHAIAVYPEGCLPTGATDSKPGDFSFASGLADLGDVPTAVVDALVDAWPDCRELRPVLSRFGSALVRLYDEEPRVSQALLHGLVLPFVATSLSEEEQASALGNVGDADGSLGAALRRLRRGLC